MWKQWLAKLHTGLLLLASILILILCFSPEPLFGIPETIWHIARLAVALAVTLYCFVLGVWVAYRVPRPKLLAFVSAMLALLLFVFALIYQTLGLVGPDGKTCNDFLPCMYFSVITFTTVGYGDFRPSDLARLFAALEALIGYFGLGLFIAALLQLFSRLPKDVDENDLERF